MDNLVLVKNTLKERTSSETSLDRRIELLSEKNYFDDQYMKGTRSGTFIHEFFVAPSVGIYDIQKLRDFTFGITPGLPQTNNKMPEINGSLLFYGFVENDEYIFSRIEEGKTRTIIKKKPVVDLEPYKNDYNTTPKGETPFSIENKFHRKITINVYPTIETGIGAVNGNMLIDRISLHQLKELEKRERGGFLNRIGLRGVKKIFK